MKRLSTLFFVMVALLVSASAFAQNPEQLSQAQKEMVIKKVMPQLFGEIEKYTGINFLGAPSLNLKMMMNSPLSPVSQRVKALVEDEIDARKLVNVQPDSTIINLGEIMPDLGWERIKMVYSGWSVMEIPIENLSCKISLPSVIEVLVPAEDDNGNAVEAPLAKITFTNTTVEGHMLDLSINVDISLLGISSVKLAVLSIVQEDTDGGKLAFDFIFDYNQNEEENFLGTLLPVDYKIVVDATGVMVSLMGGIPGDLVASLYSVSADGTITTPMGDATVNLNLGGLLTEEDTDDLPIRYALITSYTEGTPSAWNKYWFSLDEEADELALEGYSFASATATDSVATISYFLRPQDMPTPFMTPAALTARMIRSMAAAEETQLSLVVEALPAAASHRSVIGTMNVTTEASQEQMIGNVIIKGYDLDGTATTDLTMNAVLPMDGTKPLCLDIISGDLSVAKTYFTTNIAGIIAGIDETATDNIQVTTTAQGIVVANAENATYSILSVNGAMVAAGKVNSVISTNGLSQGVYILVVKANDVQKTFKFIK